jgi:hypothetical protein
MGWAGLVIRHDETQLIFPAPITNLQHNTIRDGDIRRTTRKSMDDRNEIADRSQRIMLYLAWRG